jgi:dihydroxyacetone kinase-like protein
MPVTPRDVRECLAAIATAMATNEDRLTQLDAAIGDADHGANMRRGFAAVLARLPPEPDADIAAILRATGMALVSTVGGAAGPLYGTLFLRMATDVAGKAELAGADLVAALEAGIRGVAERGRAAAGEKTLLDALLPALEALRAAVAQGLDEPAALARAAQAAEEGARATVPMAARKGRASYLGERSVGHEDPGAASSALLLRATADTLGRAGRR